MPFTGGPERDVGQCGSNVRLHKGRRQANRLPIGGRLGDAVEKLEDNLRAVYVVFEATTIYLTGAIASYTYDLADNQASHTYANGDR